MAIAVEQQKKGINIFPLLVILTLLGGAAWLGYQVFVSPVEVFEAVLSQDQQIISDLSQVTLDPAAVVNSAEFRALRKQVPDVTIGQIGRSNPFLRF